MNFGVWSACRCQRARCTCELDLVLDTILIRGSRRQIEVGCASHAPIAG